MKDRWRALTASRSWPYVRFGLGLAVLALVVWVVSSHTSELAGFSAVLSHLNWWLVPAAIVAEFGSFVCFAAMQYELLRSGGLRVPKVPLLGTTLAAQAMANSLPGGNAPSVVYGFRWFRRFGADSTLATWSLAGTLVASFVSLSLVATVGLMMATGEGASLDLVPVVIGVFAITAAIGLVFVYERPLTVVVTWLLHLSRRVIRRPRGDVTEQIRGIIDRVRSVRLTTAQVVRILVWAVLNWVLDCACFAMMFTAVHAGIPWKGLLLAYGAGQLAATLPITPGGLGAVEGSITIALVAFGGAQVATVDAVLMYRFISFWLVLAVGWIWWAFLAYQVRRGLWSRRAMDSTVTTEDSTRHPKELSDLGRLGTEAAVQ